MYIRSQLSLDIDDEFQVHLFIGVSINADNE